MIRKGDIKNMKKIVVVLLLLVVTVSTSWAIQLEPKTDADIKAEKQKYEQDITDLQDIQAAKLDTTSKLAAAVRQLAEIQERKTKTQRKLIGD